MLFKGRLWKDGKFWLIEVPALDVMTQGHTRREALYMITDAIESLVYKPNFKIKVSPPSKSPTGEETFTLSSNNESELIAFFLKQQRTLNHLTVREVAKRLGYSSPSAYAQYETGKHIPGLDKISKFLSAMNPKTRFALEIITT